MKHPVEMGEETDMSLYTGCPCDVLEFPEDKLPVCSRTTPDISELPEYPDDGMTTLLPCIVCNRTFNPAALERHRKVCEKISAKPRNVFDSTKKRLDELDVPRGLRSKDPPSPKAKSRWREKRAEFLRAIRAAKVTSEDDQNGEGHIPSDYIQCSHCSRYFGPKAAERHIEWCQEQKNRLPKYHTQEDTQAVNRLKKRTKYVPPRPGQSGWKAPKKKDVISSIPPQNAGSNHASPVRLTMTPPIPHSRHISPPPMLASRKPSPSSLPPGPPRYSTGSLGRSAGRQFSSMLQNVTGCSPGYGLSSGYGSSAMYGSPSGQSTPGYGSNFQRSASLRLPRKKHGTRMARRRDLASDMLASVGVGSKRLDPEGDEDTQSLYAMSMYERPSKPQDPHYDPFSAAELQFQSLLAPNEPGRKNGMSRGRMGSTSSLNVALKPDRNDYRSPKYKPRSSSVGPDYHNLSLLGLNPYDMRPDSDENSPIDLNSPEATLEDILAQFNNYKSPHFSPSSPFHMSPMRSPSRSPRISPTRTLGSPRGKSVEPFSDLIASLELTAGNRWPGDGANARKKSPSPALEFGRKSKESSPLRVFGRQSPSRKDDNSKYKEFNGNSPLYGWNDNYSNSFSRNLGRKSVSPPKCTTLDAANSAYDSIKILKASLDEDIDEKYKHLDSCQKRTSSGSSTDSSLPPLSSPSSVSVDQPKPVDSLAQITRFCHECGQKYPVAVAKFCCQCGARRISA